MTHETTTRQLFDRITKDETKWSPNRQMVANVFNAFPTLALPVDSVNLIARGACGLPEGETLQDALSFYVRHKVLRTRSNGSRAKLYEVNY